MNRICVILPVYNNPDTFPEVLRKTLAVHPDVLVVDDGSDCPVSVPDSVMLIRHPVNRGKGAAIRSAISFLNAKGYTHGITMDTDGQHDPEDIPLFREIIRRSPDAVVIGVRDMTLPEVPGSSRFGCRFSNFWMYLETGIHCRDCQSGFRAYPIPPLAKVKFLCNHYSFEAEVLVRAVWGGLRIREVPIRVFYPKDPAKRVTHFKPFLDNLRFSLIHAHFVALRLLPFPKKRLIPRKKHRLSIFRPKQLLKLLLREHTTPQELAMSAAVGTFLAVLPLFGFHTIAILYFTTKLRLNRILALLIQNLFMPPLSPFLCIELGYYLRHGTFLMELSLRTVGTEIPFRLWEWLYGSLILAPFWACVTGLLTWGLASSLKRK